MCHSKIRRVFAGLGTAVILALPGCLPQALAADPTDAMIATASALTQEYDLPSGLLLAVAETESGFDPDCKTGKCWGLMQIHSSYASEYAELAGLDEYDLFDPDDSLRIAAAMLDGYMDKYQGDLHYSLMCYNLGEWGAKAKRAEGVSSTGYSRKVISRIDKWADATCDELFGISERLEEDHIAEAGKMVQGESSFTAFLRGVMQRIVEVLVK